MTQKRGVNAARSSAECLESIWQNAMEYAPRRVNLPEETVRIAAEEGTSIKMTTKELLAEIKRLQGFVDPATRRDEKEYNMLFTPELQNLYQKMAFHNRIVVDIIEKYKGSQTESFRKEYWPTADVVLYEYHDRGASKVHVEIVEEWDRIIEEE